MPRRVHAMAISWTRTMLHGVAAHGMDRIPVRTRIRRSPKPYGSMGLPDQREASRLPFIVLSHAYWLSSCEIAPAARAPAARHAFPARCRRERAYATSYGMRSASPMVCGLPPRALPVRVGARGGRALPIMRDGHAWDLARLLAPPQRALATRTRTQRAWYVTCSPTVIAGGSAQCTR